MIVIIDYGAGNIRSVQNAFQRLGVATEITDDPAKIESADKVIFPGVGAAGSAMQQLGERGLDAVIPKLAQPVLGICVGMQLMCNRSAEDDTDGLGIFNTDVVRFPPQDKVPHMGWNNISIASNSRLFSGIPDQTDFYFLHSYFAEVSESTKATADYIQPFSATLEKDNFYAVQFHPEKSGKAGSQILKNFLNL